MALNLRKGPSSYTQYKQLKLMETGSSVELPWEYPISSVTLQFTLQRKLGIPRESSFRWYLHRSRSQKISPTPKEARGWGLGWDLGLKFEYYFLHTQNTLSTLHYICLTKQNMHKEQGTITITISSLREQTYSTILILLVIKITFSKLSFWFEDQNLRTVYLTHFKCAACTAQYLQLQFRA